MRVVALLLVAAVAIYALPGTTAATVASLQGRSTLEQLLQSISSPNAPQSASLQGQYDGELQKAAPPVDLLCLNVNKACGENPVR